MEGELIAINLRTWPQAGVSHLLPRKGAIGAQYAADEYIHHGVKHMHLARKYINHAGKHALCRNAQIINEAHKS